MQRREFITLLGGAAAAWPLAVRAQQANRVRQIGMLISVAESDPVGQRNAAIFRQSLQELGWEEGRNLNIERRWAAALWGRYSPTLAQDARVRPEQS